jgi:hypothetical protein
MLDIILPLELSNFAMQENINYYEGMILSLGTHVYPEDLKLANFLNGIEENPQCSTILEQYVHSLQKRDDMTYDYARDGLLKIFKHDHCSKSARIPMILPT